MALNEKIKKLAAILVQDPGSPDSTPVPSHSPSPSPSPQQVGQMIGRLAAKATGEVQQVDEDQKYGAGFSEQPENIKAFIRAQRFMQQQAQAAPPSRTTTTETTITPPNLAAAAALEKFEKESSAAKEEQKQAISSTTEQIATEQQAKEKFIADYLKDLETKEEEGSKGRMVAQLIAGIAPLIASHALRGITGATAAEASYGGGYAGAKALEGIEKLSSEEKERVGKLREIALKARLEGNTEQYLKTLEMWASILKVDPSALRASLELSPASKTTERTTTESGGRSAAHPTIPAALFGAGKPPKLGDKPEFFLHGRYELPAGLPAKMYMDAGKLSSATDKIGRYINELIPSIKETKGMKIIPSEEKSYQQGLIKEIQNQKKEMENYGAALTKLEAALGKAMFGPSFTGEFSIGNLFDYYQEGKISLSQLKEARKMVIEAADIAMKERYRGVIHPWEQKTNRTPQGQSSSAGYPVHPGK